MSACGPSNDGITAFIRRATRELVCALSLSLSPSLLSCTQRRDYMSTQWDGDWLQTKKRDLRIKSTLLALDLGLPGLQHYKKFLLLKLSAYDILLWQPELRHIPLFYFFSTSLLSGTVRCSRIFLYISYLNPRISHFTKLPNYFIGERY